MKVGDLVQISRNKRWNEYGLIVKIVSECMVEVVWAGKEYSYLEVIDNLEVVNEGW